MTDGEPEPFRMSTDPDATDDDAADADDVPAAADADDTPDDDSDAPIPGGVESIADLIDEASRTAAEQAVQEATGTAPVDRSSDVWGSPEDDDEDLDAVWSAAADRHRGSHVFDDMLGPDDDWDSSTRMPPAAADPTVGVGGADDGPDDEPEVFKLQIDDEADEPQADEPETDEPEADEPEADEPETQEPTPPAPTAGPAAAEDEDPEVFRFAAGPATVAPAEVPDHVPTAGRDEPDMFAFAFGGGPDEPDEATDDGDDTAAEVMRDDDAADDGAAAAHGPQEDPVSDERDVPAQDDGDVWATASQPDDEADDPWAAATDDDDPVWGAAPVDTPDQTWTIPGATEDDDAGGTEADDSPDDDGAWTFDVRDDAGAWDDDLEDESVDDTPGDAADDAATGTDEEPTLAESARPRADTGWNDLSDVPGTWRLDPTPTGEDDAFADDAGAQAATPDPGGFSALVDEDDADDSDDGFLPDDEPLAPTREPDPPFQTDSAGLGDVIDDLIGDLGTAPTTPDDGGDDPFEELQDALAGLDQFDDVGAAAPDAAAAAPTDDPAATGTERSTPPDLAAMPPPASAPPSADDLLTPAPPPALPPEDDDGVDDEADDGDAPREEAAPADEPAPEPEAAPEPQPEPTPQGMTFASKPKKRGLFGR